ncbi:membrane integrity-associated transporter subunit PqiC [Roseovarius sp. SYSU LYC5161]|uniref:PqiC family protein n=1 Tax=Roseovarius halophilus (ex Wu et al. 2025) TaxID=3376060 RepID=UPI00399A48BF
MTRPFLVPMIVAAAVLSACAATPEKRLAVPQAPFAKKQAVPHDTIAVREVSLPGYAASEDVYTTDAAGLLTRRHGLLWADDPTRAVTLELTRHLSRITGARVAAEPWPFDGFPEAQVEVRIEEMLAGGDGTLRLSGQYFIAAGEGHERARLFELGVPVDDDGNPASLAAARGQALRDLAVMVVENGLR